MKITKFELVKNTKEFHYDDRWEIKPGCTLSQDWQDPVTLFSFETKEQGLDELQNYMSSISRSGNYINVTEYYLQEVIYQQNEDGQLEFIESPNVWGFSNMKINITNCRSCEIVDSFDNWEDAEKKLHELEDIELEKEENDNEYDPQGFFIAF